MTPATKAPAATPLFAPPPADGNLTWRQQSVLDLVRRHGSSGIPSEQAGALAHAQSSKHGPETRCRFFCRNDGRSILAALRKRGLVKQRRADGFWTTPSAAARDGLRPRYSGDPLLMANEQNLVPAQPGNTLAVKHGATSERRVSAVATVQKRRLLRQIGLRLSDLEGIGSALLDNWARAQAKVELMDAYAAEHGFLDEAGDPRPLAKTYFTALNSARLALARLEENVVQRNRPKCARRAPSRMETACVFWPSTTWAAGSRRPRRRRPSMTRSNGSSARRIEAATSNAP